MKEFIFNENKRCINPNRYECGDKDFWIEIQTACKDGRWYHGHQYWTLGFHFKWDVYLNTTSRSTESEAICKEIDCIVALLKSDYNNRHARFEVPEKTFKQMNDLKERSKHPQLSLF